MDTQEPTTDPSKRPNHSTGKPRPAKDPTEAKPSTMTVVQPRRAFDWEALKAKVEAEHWRILRVTIRMREKLHAGKPAQLNAANAMLNARGLSEVVEAIEAERPVGERVEEVVEEGLCEFHQRPGKPGIWWPTNNFKACLKENWSVLGYRMDATPRSKRKGEGEDGEGGKRKALQGSRLAFHEGVFVASTMPDDGSWISLGEKADGVDVAVAHTTGPKGPQASIKRNEFVTRPTLAFDVKIANAVRDKIPDESFADMLLHAQEHGIGANRSQGYGQFDVLSVQEL